MLAFFVRLWVYLYHKMSSDNPQGKGGMQNFINNICVFAKSKSGDSLMGDMSSRMPYLIPLLHSIEIDFEELTRYTNYNSHGMSRLFSYFSNLSACQGYLQNDFRPLISYAISISRLSYFHVFYRSFWGCGIYGPVIP